MVILFLKLLPLLTIPLVHGSSKPLMFISGPRIGIEHNMLQLQCLSSVTDKRLLWYFSSNGSDEQYEPLSNSSSVRLESNRATLIIRSLDKSHVGSYRCCASVIDCAKFNLYVLSAIDNYWWLKPTYNDAENSAFLDVPSHGSFSLAIFHAPFNGDIYVDHESTVSFCDHFRKHGRECYENRSTDAVLYSVQNGTMEDSGQFEVKAISNQQLELFHLHILIRGSPIVQMDNYSILTKSTHINLQCQGHAYPAPNITFSYTPCSPLKMDHLYGDREKHCDKSTTLPQHLQRHFPFNYTTTFEAIVPSWPIAAGPGIISCEASNSEGTTATEAFLYVRNFPTPMSFAVISPPDVVLYDETVHLVCQVDVYNFTNQFTIQHGGSTFNLMGKMDGYAWTVTHRAYITNASQNEVSCLAHHNNGTLLVNTLNLSIRYPSKPHVVSVNDTVNVTIAFGDRFRLECDIDGTPTPDIVWFKNDHHLTNQQGHFIRVSLDLNETKATYKCVGSSRLGRASKTWNIVMEDTMQWLFIGGLGVVGFIALLLIGTIAWSVEAYRQLLTRQNAIEEQLNSFDDA